MRIIKNATPAADGFHMPAEFEPHQGCIMIFPERADSWQYGAYAARKAFVQVAEVIARSEQVTVCASAASRTLTGSASDCRREGQKKEFEDALSFLDDDSSDADKEPIDADMLEDAYVSIAEMAEMMDYDSVEMILNEVADYRLPKEDRARFKDMEKKLIEAIEECKKSYK